MSSDAAQEADERRARGNKSGGTVCDNSWRYNPPDILATRERTPTSSPHPSRTSRPCRTSSTRWNKTPTYNGNSTSTS